jgi:uncharacterized protein (DUF302 family)
MRAIATALTLATAVVATSLPANAESLVAQQSKHTVAETMDRLAAELTKRGIKVAARIDHAAGAKAVGMELPPTQVMMFGNPKLGTPLMQVKPEIGLDLPMKVIAWQDKAGKVWVGYAPPAGLAKRYGVEGKGEVLTAMTNALAALTKAAAGN